MRDETGGLARVKVEGEESLVIVPVSTRKPAIPELVQEKWQKIVDLVAGILHVPSGLITRFTEENLEIFVASKTKGNPYKRDDRDKLGIGMFCETVAGKRRELRVDDTVSSEFWAGNPHASLGMKAYMGVPIQWDDGELFGTLCVLNDRANQFQSDYLELLLQFKEIVETDLRYLLLQTELESRLDEKELELREIYHRQKNQFNLLISYINLQSHTDSNGSVKATLKEVEHRVLALSMINEELYKSAEVSAPKLGLYLSRLCDYILDDFMKRDIEVEYAIDDMILPTETEVSIALIVSELITNSVKYAFPEPGPKKIRIAARRAGDGSLSMSYADNGIGFPESFDPQKAKTLGIILIKALVKQLNGTMTIENEGGAKFSFRFED